MSGGCSADRPGLLTFEPVADSAGGGMRPVTSGYNCSEVLGGGSCHKSTRDQIGWSVGSAKQHLHLFAVEA